jgi:hypothetical protein
MRGPIKMINNILIAAAVTIPVTPLCAPILAEEITSPKPTPVLSSSPTPKSTSFGFMAGALGNSGGSETMPPSMSLGVRAITNNISCRNTARSKFFELGARDMSPSDSNSQWATIGNMKAIVWCRDSQAVISVAGYSYDSVTEVRDVLGKAF